MSKNTKYGNKKKINSIFAICIVIAILFGYAAGYLTSKWSAKPSDNKKVDTINDTFGEGDIIDYQKEGYIKLGEYKGRTIQVTSTDEDIQIELESIQRENEITKNHQVKKGDKIVIDYSGSLDGIAFDGGTAEDVELVVGTENDYLEDFNNGLIGKEVGKTTIVDVTFPEDYDDASLAGKKTKFTMNIKSYIPELTDALIVKFTKNKYKTINAYKEYLVKKVKQDNMDSLGETAWDEIREDSTFLKLPKAMKKVAKKDIETMYKNFAEVTEQTVEEVMESMGASDESMVDDAEEKAQNWMIARTIATIEGITLDDASYKKVLVETMDIADDDIEKKTVSELESEYKKTQSSNPKDDMLVEIVKQFIVKNTKTK